MSNSLRKIRVRYRHWWFCIFPGAGVTLYPYILFKRSPAQVSERLRRHELEHVYQVWEHGWLWFYISYLGLLIRHGYRNHPYEKAARRAADDLMSDEEREVFRHD